MSAVSPAINPLYLPGGMVAEHNGVNRHIVPALRGGRAPARPGLVRSHARGPGLADGRAAGPVTNAGNLVQPASNTAGFHLTTSL